MIFQGVQKLISGVIPSSEIGGVITIGKVISDASESSFNSTFNNHSFNICKFGSFKSSSYSST